ncbi:MAG: polyphenol oxidase family protein, partial [Rectinema sp.]|nr:polyphenol oxidase family protein [Rectinema sp.]
MNQTYMEFRFNLADENAPRAIMSLRNAGDMKFSPGFESDTRRSFLTSLSIEPERLAGIELKHGRNVAFIESHEELAALVAHNTSGFDGIVTRNPRLVPSVTVADCMPIWIFCRHCGAFGILHSGWKGTGILAVAVHEMERNYGCTPDNIHLILGPAIGACCYQVDLQRAMQFSNEFGPQAIKARQEPGSTFYLDLRAANLGLAKRLGITNVANIEICT